MITKLDKLDNEKLNYINEINTDNNYLDPFERNNKDYIKMCTKKHNITLLVTKENVTIGLFCFYIIDEEKYIELLLASSKDENAYNEIFEYLDKNYLSYDVYFVYNPKNEILNKILRERKAEFLQIQKQMICEKYLDKDFKKNIIKYSNEYETQYIEIHNNDVYWTAKKVLKCNDFFILLALNENKELVGYVDVSKNIKNNHISDVFVKEEYRNLGYGKALINEVIKVSSPKIVSLEVDDNNYAARNVYESLNFKYESNKDEITVILRKIKP